MFSSKYFKATQAAVFYKKNAFKMFESSLFMFLGLPVSCDKNQIKLRESDQNKKMKLREN